MSLVLWIGSWFVLAWSQGTPSRLPWLAEVQRAPARLPANAPQLSPLLVDKHGQPIATLDDWRTRREELRTAWREFLGPLPKPATTPKLKVLSEERLDGVLRQRVRYDVEPGETVEAFLLRPIAARSRLPAVVVFHSTVNQSIDQPAGIRGEPELFFGLTLAKRGYLTLCPRNFLWPANDRLDTASTMRRFAAKHPKSKGMARMLHDAIVAVDILAARDDVDAQRLGAIGHSLGAKEVLYLAAFDERVRATVSSEGGIGLKFSNWHDEWYLGRSIQTPRFDREHHELLALVAPRAFLLVGGDSADGDRSWPFIEVNLPVWQLFGGSAAVGLLNHRQGHRIPKSASPRILEWLEVYLR